MPIMLSAPAISRKFVRALASSPEFSGAAKKLFSDLVARSRAASISGLTQARGPVWKERFALMIGDRQTLKPDTETLSFWASS